MKPNCCGGVWKDLGSKCQHDDASKQAGWNDRRIECREYGGCRSEGQTVELIRRDISGFMKKWADASITFEGVLIRAKLMDLIREKPGSGGSVSWYYSPDVSAKYFQTGTQHITNSVPGQASMQALKEWFLADTSRIQKLSQIIGDYDQAVKASDNLTDALFEPSTVTPGAQVEEKPFNPAEAEVPELVAFGFEYEVLTTYKEADVTKVAFVKSESQIKSAGC
jgi:hypothetical protein